MCFVIYQEQNKKWWENVIFTKRVLSRLTAPLTWAASLGWTSAVTCYNIHREYYVRLAGKLCSILRANGVRSLQSWVSTVGELTADVYFSLFKFSSFYILVRWFCSSHHSNRPSYETQPDLILVLDERQFLLNLVFVWFCLTCNDIMHIWPPLMRVI